MKYIVKMPSDEFIIKEIEADSVFDAIDIAAIMVENPVVPELIEAYPVM